MPEFLHKIHAIEDSDGVTQEIVPLGLQSNNHTATLPTLSADATIALSSDIPTVNNGTLTIQGSGTTATTFSANQSANVTLNIKGSGKTTVTKTADNEITIGSNADDGNADTVDTMHMLDQTYAYKERLVITEGCVGAVVHTGLTESEIFALTGNRYGQLYLASDTNKYWRRKDTQTAANVSHWRNDTTAATNANALPNQLTTEDAIYVKLDTKTKYYSKLPKFFVEASYDNINGSTAITGFCRQPNQFDITACAYNGNNLVGIYQPSGNTDIYYFKFARFRSIYGATSQCSVSQIIYTNFSTNGATLTFIDVNSPEYATVSGYLYISVPTFGEDRTAINGSLLPREDKLRNLGSSTLQWNNIYGNNIYGKQIYEDGKALSTKYQAALATQTAYSAKGSATKVPQITTNNLGQVTGITEVTITDNNDNQTVKVGSTTFTASAAIDLIAGTNMTVTAVTNGAGAPSITFDATDTGATTITVSGAGNVVDSATYNPGSRMITLTKGVTAITAHQSIKILDTRNTTAQTPVGETITGSGTINLHKVAKTGSYLDLNNLLWTEEKDSEGEYIAVASYNAMVAGYMRINDEANSAPVPRPTNQTGFTNPDVYIFGSGITIHENTDSPDKVLLSYPNYGGTLTTEDRLPNVKRYI